jgi:hypothetical protein
LIEPGSEIESEKGLVDKHLFPDRRARNAKAAHEIVSSCAKPCRNVRMAQLPFMFLFQNPMMFKTLCL